MAIIHDIVEAETENTDYAAIAIGKISKEEQRELERKAIVQLTQILPEKTGKEIFNLWTEFDEGKTKESKYVKSINKLETLIYLLEVGHTCYSRPELIFDYIKNANEIPELKEIFDEVKKQLEEEVSKIKKD
jgi:putative hydrolase of HD superfamily